MTQVSRSQVELAIKGFKDPYLDLDLVSANTVRQIAVDNGTVTVQVELGYPAAGFRDELAAPLRERIEALDGVNRAMIDIRSTVVSHAVQQGVKPLPNIKNIIAG